MEQQGVPRCPWPNFFRGHVVLARFAFSSHLSLSAFSSLYWVLLGAVSIPSPLSILVNRTLIGEVSPPVHVDGYPTHPNEISNLVVNNAISLTCDWLEEGL